jgi:hypothetical protein
MDWRERETDAVRLARRLAKAPRASVQPLCPALTSCQSMTAPDQVLGFPHTTGKESHLNCVPLDGSSRRRRWCRS